MTNLKNIKIKRENLPAATVKLTITVPVADWNSFEEEILENLKLSLNIPGFRAGKAPQNLVRGQIEEDKLAQEVLERILPLSYGEAVKKEKIKPIGAPRVKIIQFEKGKDFKYEAEIALYPEIKLGDYKKIKIAKPKVKLDKKDVDRELSLLIKRFADFKETKKNALKDNRVLIDFKTQTEKGEEIADFNGQNEPVVIGGDNLIKDFSEKLEGKKAGDKIEFVATLPKDFQKTGLAGQKVKFLIEVKSVQEVIEPTMKELAKKLGHEKEEELREKITEYLSGQKEKQAENEWENMLVEKVAAKSKVEVAPALVEQEQERLIGQISQDLAMQGQTLDAFLAKVKSTKDEFAAQFKAQAEKNLTFSFILQAIADKEKISVSDKEIEVAMQKEKMNLKMQGHKDEEIEKHQAEDSHKQSISSHLKLDKALAKLKEINV
ncbi:MAG: trigger factor [Patescibacteria group bacterium]|nr:trigger factor [Patescibacteria group bacterium]